MGNGKQISKFRGYQIWDPGTPLVPDWDTIEPGRE
jgi:hypothetical protein